MCFLLGCRTGAADCFEQVEDASVSASSGLQPLTAGPPAVLTAAAAGGGCGVGGGASGASRAADGSLSHAHGQDPAASSSAAAGLFQGPMQVGGM